MHNSVTFAVVVAATAQTFFRRVQRLLKDEVKIGRAYNSSLHRGKHLDFTQRHLVALGQPVLHKIDDGSSYTVGIIILDEEEICVHAIADVREPPFIDGMGTHNNTAGLGLTEYTGQPYYWYLARLYDVAQDIAGTYTGQLVDVSDQYQAHGF